MVVDRGKTMESPRSIRGAILVFFTIISMTYLVTADAMAGAIS
jgi:succinate dehydrogenase/fumarate reductase cytochrome b subunit